MKKKYWILSGVIGFLVFTLIFDIATLNPLNLAWINGSDPIDSYLSWHFFRYSRWQVPIGVISNFGITSTFGIIWADMVAGLAIPIKILSNWLPEPFQYF